MTLGHIRDNRKYQARGSGGGGKTGRRSVRWPRLLKVIAKAVSDNMKGSEEAWAKDSHRPDDFDPNFLKALEAMAPGVETWAQKNRPDGDTDWLDNLWNRCYKMEYDGTSNGRQEPQWCRGKEHWRHWKRAADFERYYDQVRRGVPVKHWKDAMVVIR